MDGFLLCFVFCIFPNHQVTEEMATTQTQLKVNPHSFQLRWKSRNEINTIQRKKNLKSIYLGF